MTELNDTIHRSLSTFASEALNGSWNGCREREAISLFVLGFLARFVNEAGFLKDLTQVGIEVPVPQLDIDTITKITGRASSKSQVCKDVVIWPHPRMTCWDNKGEPTVAPSAILEWKFNAAKVYAPDIEWLRQYSLVYPGFIGYAVTANQPGREFILSCSRVADGDVEPDWLRITDLKV